ncbi:MAG: hypothetical protein ACT4OP_04590 [Actinomycetota bacterium]
MKHRSDPSQDLRSLADHLRARTRPEAAAQAASVAVKSRAKPPIRPHRVILAAALVVVLSNVGVAALANSAVPGDFWYGQDRGYEWLLDHFVPSDHADERLAEARVLAERGDSEEALSLVAEVVGQSVGQSAGQSVSVESVRAAASLAANAQSSAVQIEVLELIETATDLRNVAKSGNLLALKEAIEQLHDAARDVAETASDGKAGGRRNETGRPGGPPGSPGRGNSPNSQQP